jgi:hypothetical protein
LSIKNTFVGDFHQRYLAAKIAGIADVIGGIRCGIFKKSGRKFKF